MLLATLDPATGEDRIVLRMRGIHEVDRILFALVLLELLVLLQERALSLWISLAGDETLGFL